MMGHKYFVPALGSALLTVIGLAVWSSKLKTAFEDASYDNLFRFGSPPATRATFTNGIVLLSMDNATWREFQVERGTPIRGRHDTITP